MKKRYLTCLLLALLLLGACQPQEEAASAGSFTVTFTDHSGAAATALEVYLFDADALSPSLTRPRSGYLASTSIHAPGRDSGDTAPMAQGETYPSVPFSADTVPVLGGEDAPEEVVLCFDLDGARRGQFSAPLDQLWGGTVQCQLDREGRFSTQLTGDV